MMEQIVFNVSLRGGTAEGEFRRYAPGEQIGGTVQVIPNQDVKARGATVRLQWRTEGRGDLNSQTVGEMEIWQGPLQKGRPVEREFEFQLPEQPWSFSGHYISIVWEILVFVDVPLATDPKFSQPFILRPG